MSAGTSVVGVSDVMLTSASAETSTSSMVIAADADVPDVVLPLRLIPGTPATPGDGKELWPRDLQVCVLPALLTSIFEDTHTAAAARGGDLGSRGGDVEGDVGGGTVEG